MFMYALSEKKFDRKQIISPIFNLKDAVAEKFSDFFKIRRVDIENNDFMKFQKNTVDQQIPPESI